MDNKKLLETVGKDLPGQIETMEQLAPIIQMMMDGYIDDLEQRFQSLAQNWFQIISNVFAVNDLLIEREIFTEEDLRAAVSEAGDKVSEAIQAQETKTEKAGDNIEV
tara:strand:+ start:1271 stop:1591 length:321 start_codon:yes stop_codon:yes gene_type:complete